MSLCTDDRIEVIQVDVGIEARVSRSSLVKHLDRYTTQTSISCAVVTFLCILTISEVSAMPAAIINIQERSGGGSVLMAEAHVFHSCIVPPSNVHETAKIVPVDHRMVLYEV
jgi:hypothetical protein